MGFWDVFHSIWDILWGNSKHPPAANKPANASANNSVVYDESWTGDELFFFAHGDWGKGGYDGSYHDRRHLKERDGIRRRPRGLEGGGGGEGRREEGDHEEGDHDHDEEHDHEGEDEHEHEHEHEEEVFYQMNTSRSMQIVANKTRPSFIMALGDNFYQDGVESVTDSLWSTLWKKVYFEESDVLKGIPWHAVIGNHDLGYGDEGVFAQINRTRSNLMDDDDGVWQTYGQWYTIKYTIPNAGGFLQIVAVDTTWLSPSENEATNEEGGISNVTQAARIKTQLLDLYEIFQDTVSNRPTWLIVAGHYNIFSKADKGDNDELITYLVPLMEHYGVHAYICGHDHINEHLQYHNIEYIVAGASTMTNELSDESTSADLIWAGENYAAFTRFAVTRDRLLVDFIDNDATVVYRYANYNPNVPPSPLPTSMPTRAPTLVPSSAPSSFPTFAPTVYSFCDRNPDYPYLCDGSNANSYVKTGSKNDNDNPWGRPRVIASVIASLILIVLLAVFGYKYCRRKSHRKKTDEEAYGERGYRMTHSTVTDEV